MLCHMAGFFDGLDTAPEFRADSHRFVTILYRATAKAGEKRPEKIPETGPVKTRDEILALLRNDFSMTIAAVCKKVGVTMRVTEQHFERLKKDGIIKRIGSDKGGCWKILAEPSKE